MDAQSMIEIYRTGFYISSAIAVLGFCLAVLFFFRFHIRSVWAIRTGKAQRDAVKALQQSSRSDGRMRKEEKQRELSTEEMAGTEAEATEALKMTELTDYGSTHDLEQTTVLGPDKIPDFGMTLDLGSQLSTVPAGSFLITQEVVLIHTTEAIPE